MKPESVLESAIKFVARVALIDVAIFGIVALACWFAGRCTLGHYGTGLTMAGALAIAVGGYSLLGSGSANRSVNHPHADVLCQHAGSLVRAVQNYAFLALMGTAGLVSILFGEVIRTSIA